MTRKKSSSNSFLRLSLKQLLKNLFLSLFSFLVILITVLTWQLVQANTQSNSASPVTQVQSPTVANPSPTPTILLDKTTNQATSKNSSTFSSQPSRGIESGKFNQSIIISLDEDSHFHLFSYNPLTGESQRISYGNWDDITPAISPDGKWLAFASNRNGFWDLYLMQLSSGNLKQLTNTPEYDAFPSWSPDNQWIIFETYNDISPNANMDLKIISISNNEKPIQLTNDASADMAPTWSPEGRWIAFVSTKSGNRDIWTVNLDNYNFQNLTNTRHQSEAHPVWAPDGKHLTWSARSEDGTQKIYIWDISQPNKGPAEIGNGDWITWNPSGNTILTTLSTSDESFITSHPMNNEGVKLPYELLKGDIFGITWGKIALPEPLPALLLESSLATPTPLWQPAISSQSNYGRIDLVPLSNVTAPNPMLQDTVDEAFQALRAKVGYTAGWDFLANLENAFVPLTSALGPGMVEDWRYTGRSFSFNPAPINAGWVVVTREDIGTETYWRVYLKARFQDGSQGIPLRDLPWDFNARYSNKPLAYEKGGGYADTIPNGYWIDFTRLAQDFGWERLPALNSWYSAFSTAQFNTFAHKDGRDWFTAMLEIYPQEALDTPTPVPSPTPTLALPPTATPTSTISPDSQNYNQPTPLVNKLFNGNP